MPLPIHIDAKELWDSDKEVFVYTNECDILLEHSLVSVSKWEAKYHKSFIDTEKTLDETLDYIKMMVIGKQPPDDVFNYLSKEQVKQIGDYINDPMTATTIPEDEDNKKSTIKTKYTTSEEIYYYMIAQNIPAQFEHWHLNRLITLIKVCAYNNKPEDKKKKKMTTSDLMARRIKMEAARKKYGGG